MRTPLPVAASIAQRPGYGGHAWAFFQYAVGLRQLGYEPILIDRLSAGMTAGADEISSAPARHTAIEWFRQVTEFAGLAGSSSLLLEDGETIGLTRSEVGEAIAAAPCLLNLMGFLTDPDLLDRAETLVFVDVDPGFPQLWRELGLADLFAGHHRFVSVGANLGHADCGVPTCGLEWIAIRPPVALDLWQCAPAASRVFRGVGSWRGPYGPIEHRGRTLGLRVHEFRKFAALPRRVDAECELALDIDPADSPDMETMRANEWRLADPAVAAGSPSAYRDFVQSSGAEIAIAKNIYVDTNSGWFSDRSACFLASGRPVLAQDTGFAASLPTGEGLLAFGTLEEAVAGAEEILGDWPRHSRAARALSEETFDAKKVLGEMLSQVGVA
ncbi:MAG: hypothetical protein ACLGG5_09905 [Thermoleophilia bacterium]